jgi:hypothetical protein
MRINKDVHLPANSTAKLGQTSLLGSMHIELAPPTDEPPEGELTNGSVIPLARADTYPTTEQTLASVSVLLNGGGLGQLQEINQAFAKALAGRENEMRSLLNQLDIFISQLNEQTDDIISATEHLNSLAGQVAAKDPIVDKALTTIPQALAVLSDSRAKLANAIDALGKFSAIATSTVNQTKDSFINNLRNMAGVQGAGQCRARAHQGAGLPFDIPVGEEHAGQLVPRRLRQHHARHRSDAEPDRQQPVHRDPVGGRSHHPRTAVGSHDRADAEPVHRGQSVDRAVSVGCVLTWCG